MKSARRHLIGFTLIELMVVVAILGVLLATAIQAFSKNREYAQTQLCIQNLTQIESVKDQWALETGQEITAVPTNSDLFGPNKYMKVTPVCPAAGIYTLNQIGVNATCTIPFHEIQ